MAQITVQVNDVEVLGQKVLDSPPDVGLGAAANVEFASQKPSSTTDAVTLDSKLKRNSQALPDDSDQPTARNLLTSIPKLLRIARNSSEELKSQIPKIKRSIIFNNNSEGWDNVRLVDVIVIHAAGGLEKDANLSLFETDIDTSLPLTSTTEKILTGARRSNNPVGFQRASRARSPRPGKEGAAAGLLKLSAITPSPTYDSLSRRADTGLSQAPEIEKPNWLTDEAMLPSAVPVAQIMVFNLDLGSNSYAPIDFDGTAATIEAQIRELRVGDQFRSMVFIGHGYGNVVLERLLATHSQEQAPKTGFVGAASKSALIDSTAAVVFFAAPFLSSDPLIEWTAQALKVSKSAKIFSSISSKDLIAPSKTWAGFLELAKQKNICSIAFLELNLDQGLEEISREKADVDKLKAMLDDVSEKPKGIGDVAKFSGPNDEKFWRMCSLIDIAVQKHQFLGAAKRGDNNTIKNLIKQSINVNISFGDGQTALHWATREKKIDVIETLVGNDSLDIDRQAEDGTTALHLSVSHENLHGFVEEDIMDELLAAGASPSIRDRRGRTPNDIIALVKNPPLWMKVRLKRAQLVKGPSAWPDLTIGKPPAGIGITACENTTMKLKGIFAARPGQPDNHIQISPSILELIYSDQDAETILESYHGSAPGIRVPEIQIKEFCQWFHIPANNMAWVHDLFVKLKYNIWPWPARQRSSKLVHSRCMYPQVATVSSNDGREALVILMPYISYEAKNRQLEIDSFIRDVNAGFDYDPLKGSEEKKDFLGESLVSTIRAYMNYKHAGHDLPLHPRRTLDQSYYHMLEDTSYRDATQVVSRWWAQAARTRGPLGGVEGQNHNILMVDQLWLWCIKPEIPGNGDPYTVITSFPSREGANPTVVDYLERTVLKSKKRKPIVDTVDLISRILTVCSTTLDRHQDPHPSLQFLQMFESTIGHAEEELTRLFKDFSKTAKILHSLNEMHYEYQEQRSKLLKRLLDIRKESNLLERVKDLLDEIKMIQAIIKDQLEVLGVSEKKRSSEIKDFFGAEWKEGGFNEPLKVLRGINDNFRGMEALAMALEKGLDQLLDLKQKQANLWEARCSREGAEETANQGKTLMVFTIVTIIFLPLSFMASFFALGVTQFPKDTKSGNTSWPLTYICWLLFGTSLAVSIPFILLAFKISWLEQPWIRFRHIWIKKVAARMLDVLLLTIPIDAVQSKISPWRYSLELSILRYESLSKVEQIGKLRQSGKLRRWGRNWSEVDAEAWEAFDPRNLPSSEIAASEYGSEAWP